MLAGGCLRPAFCETDGEARRRICWPSKSQVDAAGLRSRRGSADFSAVDVAQLEQVRDGDVLHLPVANLVAGDGRIMVFNPGFERGERFFCVRACVEPADSSGEARDNGKRPGVGGVDLAGERCAFLP
jgi:hypothetical protein